MRFLRGLPYRLSTGLTQVGRCAATLPPNMVHHVFACRTNVGDWLSALGIQAMLCPLSLREYWCDSAFASITIERLSRLPRDSTIVVGGGGLFHVCFREFWEGLQTIADRSRLYIWGVGCCAHKDTETRLPTSVLQPVIESSRYCSVRDQLTWDYLRAHDLPPPVPCPAFCEVGAEPTDRGWGLLNVTHPDLLDAPTQLEIRTTCKDFAQSTERPVRQTQNRVRSGNAHSLCKLLKLYGASDLVVSSRLHGCVIALAMEKKVIAVSADSKIDSFMQAANLLDWVCHVDDVSRLEQLISAVSEQPSRAAFTDEVRRQNRAIADIVKSNVAPLADDLM